MKDILRQRQNARRHPSGVSERVRRFYQTQDELIDGYERAEKRANQDQDEQEKQEAAAQRDQKMTKILSRASLGVNIVSMYYCLRTTKTHENVFFEAIISHQNCSCHHIEVTFHCINSSRFGR